MHQSVLERFVEFSAPLEGVVTSLYVDIKQLVTVGIGCLADPVQMAMNLPWVLPDGSRPTRDEIARQWRSVKAEAPRLAKLHWRYAAALTTIRLTDEGVLEVVRERLIANEKVLRGYFPNWDLFPADAQLACCSIAWAVGAGFPATFGNFRAAANAQNWTAAISASGIRTDNNPGIVPRNAANRLCLANAQQVLSQGIPLDTLFWPDTAPSASQRDEALRTEAQLAAQEHAAHNAAAWDALTIKLREGIDLTQHDDNESPDPDVA